MERRVGGALKRLIGAQPVRYRMQPQAERRLLQDEANDARVAQIVRNGKTLQLCGPCDATPLVLDIDQLTEGGGRATAKCLAVERLQVAARVIGDALQHAFGLKLTWFASGLQAGRGRVGPSLVWHHGAAAQNAQI